MSYKKAPLGIEPKWMWEEKRLKALIEAIERRLGTEFQIPREWIEEHNELIVKTYTENLENIKENYRKTI